MQPKCARQYLEQELTALSARKSALYSIRCRWYKSEDVMLVASLAGVLSNDQRFAQETSGCHLLGVSSASTAALYYKRAMTATLEWQVRPKPGHNEKIVSIFSWMSETASFISHRTQDHATFGQGQ